MYSDQQGYSQSAAHPASQPVGHNIAHGPYVPGADDAPLRAGEPIADPANGEAGGEETSFEAALKARYERLSLLTLDLAQEAGEAVRDRARTERGAGPGRFDHGVRAMTKAIWAHTVIERLRTGKPVVISGFGCFRSRRTAPPHESGWGRADRPQDLCIRSQCVAPPQEAELGRADRPKCGRTFGEQSSDNFPHQESESRSQCVAPPQESGLGRADRPTSNHTKPSRTFGDQGPLSRSQPVTPPQGRAINTKPPP